MQKETNPGTHDDDGEGYVDLEDVEAKGAVELELEEDDGLVAALLRDLRHRTHRPVDLWRIAISPLEDIRNITEATNAWQIWREPSWNNTIQYWDELRPGCTRPYAIIKYKNNRLWWVVDYHHDVLGQVERLHAQRFLGPPDNVLICQSTVFDKLLIIWFSDNLVILLFDPPVGYIIVRVAKAANLKRTPLQKNKKVTVN